MKTIKDVDMGLCFTVRTGSMKECGLMIKDTKKDMSDTVMVTLTREISKKEKLMVREYIYGLMAKSMTVNGVGELRTVMECGRVFLEIVTWVNGLIQKLMVMEFINGKMVIDLREAGINA